MSKTTARKIKELRALLDLTQSELGEKLDGVPQSTISKWERDLQEPDSLHTIRLAGLAGVEPHEWMGIPPVGKSTMSPRRVRLVGTVQAGNWREAVEDDGSRYVEAPLPEWLSGLDIQAFEVAGPSMNRIYPDGTTVYVASTSSYRGPVDKDRVMVVRTSAAGLVEVTLKEYILGEDGKRWLWPRSYDPEFQAPLPYVEGSSGEDIIVSGIVVAALVLEVARKIDTPTAKRRRTTKRK